MNERNERRERTRRESDQDVTALQVEIENLGAELAVANETIEDLQDSNAALIAEIQAAKAAPAVAPAGDAELRALAATIRTAQRAGHPDAAKHVDALLKLLGA